MDLTGADELRYVRNWNAGEVTDLVSAQLPALDQRVDGLTGDAERGRGFSRAEGRAPDRGYFGRNGCGQTETSKGSRLPVLSPIGPLGPYVTRCESRTLNG